MVELTSEQQKVLDSVIKDVKKDKLDIRIGGYAGTGKTSLIQHIIDSLPGFAVAAYTGKATNVLKRKGVEASTIHSLIYTPEVIEDEVVFNLAPSLACKGIIIDEASMVSSEIYNDLKSFEIPLIFVGDHGQLEPIGKDEGLMQAPHYVLEEIHRNAGEIAHFAEFIRKGFRPAAFKNKSPENIHFITKREASKLYLEVDQIICAFNKTRVQINAECRAQKGRTGDWPVTGDTVMCLRNNKNLGLFNGMQGLVKYAYAHPDNKMLFQSNGLDFWVRFDPSQFGREKYDFSGYREDPDPFDWCDAITAHKSQGDEWDDVMVFEQKSDFWDQRRWSYTAASRARNSLLWVAA